MTQEEFLTLELPALCERLHPPFGGRRVGEQFVIESKLTEVGILVEENNGAQHQFENIKTIESPYKKISFHKYASSQRDPEHDLPEHYHDNI